MRYALGAILALFFCLPVLAGPSFDSAVKVEGAGGHGSGVYIGHGYVLTAGHVAEIGETTPLTIVHPRGANWTDTWSAQVVWVDKVGDFGLLKINAVVTDEVLPAAKLDCREPDTSNGQTPNVTIVGWPVDLGMVQSTGYVTSDDRERGPWKRSFVVVAPIYFGNSGGPIFGADGKVVGLAVGIVRGSSLGIMVPSSAICDALPASIEK